MYYLTGNKHGSKYGVVDTSDGNEDFLSVSELLSAESRGFQIYGMLRKSGYLYCFGVNLVTIELLNRPSSSPVLVRLSGGLGFMQTVYMGYRISTGNLEFVFFNDSGMSGLCVVTSSQLLSGEVSVSFDKIDVRRFEVLMRRLKDSGEFRL